MSRYRMYGPLDDPSQEEGDRSFVGVNAYDRPENLQSGQVQAATNVDFTSGDAETRGGFVCIPELGNAPFGAGYDWTSQRSGTVLKNFSGVAFGNNLFVAVSTSSGPDDVLYSTDGVTWLTATTGLSAIWTDITFGEGLFVAISVNSPTSIVATSPDGITWTQQTIPDTSSPGPSNSWSALAYGNGRFVAVANSGGSARAMYSLDGVTWVLATSTPTDAYTSVTYGAGKFVAVANIDNGGGSTMSSADGVTWTGHAASFSASWEDVTFAVDTFVAVSDNGTGSNSVMTSADGDAWVSRASPDGFWLSVTYGAGLFVAVSNEGVSVTDKVMTSPDGVTWTAGDAANVTPWTCVGYGAGTFVAVGDTVDVAYGFMTSGYRSGPTSVFASCVYSDPNTPTDTWVALAGPSSVGFYAFGKTSRSVDYPGGFTLSEQGTLVQANNQLFLFPGEGQTPIYWAGDWSLDFAAVPASTLGVGFESIPESNQATFAQNRLWVVNGKDQVAASDVLDFEEYDQIANDFNLNTGAADYVVCSYPFGDNSLVVFKHNSSILLENVQGSLADVTATEISRNLGIIGINAVTAVGPDLVYVSDRNISTIRLNLQNKLQNVTEPLSRNIGPLIDRVNWQYAYKISMGYWDNRLFVAVPMDNSTVCNTILVYNFVTQQWYGEWTFSDELAMRIQGFVVANYLGQLRLHVITEDGRIFVTGQSYNDISGSTVSEISTSLTTRAYALGNAMQAPQRVNLDVSTNRPSFSVAAYADGANEYTEILSDQTFSRADSWLWNDSPYTMTNANDDYNRAFRKDYATGPDSIQARSGFIPEMPQDYRLPIITRRRGRLAWINVANTQGYLRVNSLSIEAREGSRSNLTQVG